MKEWVLTKQGAGTSSTFELVGPEGTRTVFSMNSSGGSESDSYRPTTVSWQAAPKSSRMVYQLLSTGSYRLVKMIAPAPAGVTCTDSGASTTPGCRSLSFQYTEAEHPTYERMTSITYHNSSGEPSQAQVVSQYEYDSNLQLIARWDPRISPALKETYSYGATGSAYKLASLTPPGQEPVTFGYYETSVRKRLRSVSRPSLLSSGPTTSQTTIVYAVPISGAGAPYDMSPATIATWGQADYPVNATAVFPPTQVPSETPSDYSQAVVKYMDPDGYLVNTASPQMPGASGPSIVTSETDRHGNITRSLSAENRLAALAAGSESIALSRKLDTQSTYSADGTEMLESLGPLHSVRLESGATVEARAHTVVEYDKDANGNDIPPPPTGTPSPHLPTKETASAKTAEGDVDKRVTETRYDWSLRKPTETIVDPSGLKIRTVTGYDSTGLPIEVRQPKDAESPGAGTTKTVYYQAGGSGECQAAPRYAGLPCKILPAAQPGTPGQPALLVKMISTYNRLDQPTLVTESPGGGSEGIRRTRFTYDNAGRQLTKLIEGGGVELPKTETVYSPTSGLPTTQRFVCPGCTNNEYVSSFGSNGSNDGQFAGPGGTALDSDGSLWVADSQNNRVQKFSPSGEHLLSFGTLGSGNGQFKRPTDIAIDSKGNLWVADTLNGRIQQFDDEGNFLKAVEANIDEPRGIATDAYGLIWVADPVNSRAVGLTAQGVVTQMIPGQGLIKPTGIAINKEGTIWVAGPGTVGIAEYSRSGVLQRVMGPAGTGQSQLSSPTAIEIDEKNNVWVADVGNNRIKRFHRYGEFMTEFGTSGKSEGQIQLSQTTGIASGPGGAIWVSDSDNHRVQKWINSTDDTQATTTTYDTLGRVTAYQDADGNTAETTYDLLDRPVTVNDGKGAQTATYDSTTGVLTELQDSAAGAFTAAYNADGALIERGLPNGLVARTTYDEAGTPSHLSYVKTTMCSSGCTWLDFSSEESIHGQVLARGSTLSSQIYSYDKAGRLTRALDTSQAGSCTTRSYGFDSNSNRTVLVTRAPGLGGICDTTSTGTTQNYNYDAADRLLDNGLTYDSFGRITSLPASYAGGSDALTTEYFSNDMVARQSQGSVTNTFQLDATGRQRLRLQGGGLEGSEVFHYADDTDSSSWAHRGSSWTRNIDGIDGELAAVQDSSSGVTLQLTNLHGDVVGTASLSQSATKPTATFEFDEFGKPKQAGLRFGWLGGKQHRTELPSGVIQMGARSYVPAIGRFLSPDPVLGGSANPYDYSYQDPVNVTDLDGRCPACLVGLGLALRYGAGLAARSGARAAPRIASTLARGREPLPLRRRLVSASRLPWVGLPIR